MKKAAALFAALAIVSLPGAFAQTTPNPTVEGTFTGNVGGRCHVKSNMSTNPLIADDVEDDGFVNSLGATGSFNFRSNSQCYLNPAPSAVFVSDSTTVSDSTATPSCTVPVTTPLNTAQTAGNGTALGVSVDVTDSDILLAGIYKVKCTVNISASAQ